MQLVDSFVLGDELTRIGIVDFDITVNYQTRLTAERGLLQVTRRAGRVRMRVSVHVRARAVQLLCDATARR